LLDGEEALTDQGGPPFGQVAQVGTRGGGIDAHIDAHVHVGGSDIVRYPVPTGFNKDIVQPASSTPEEILKQPRPAGVRRINLIQISFYGFDNSCLLAAIAQYPDVFVASRSGKPTGSMVGDGLAPDR
jgi:hypothetical protein